MIFFKLFTTWNLEPLMNLAITQGKTDSKNVQLVLTLPQNKLNGDVTTHESNLSCNKSGCYRGRGIKVAAESRERFYFLQKKPVHVARFIDPWQTCFSTGDVTAV